VDNFEIRSWDGAVGIATRFGLEGPGIESRWGRDFPHLSRPAPRPTQLLYNGYRIFPGIKRPGRGVDHPPPSSVPRFKEKSRAISLFSLRGPRGL
jgi:hypothetical protein